MQIKENKQLKLLIKFDQLEFVINTIKIVNRKSHLKATLISAFRLNNDI